MLHEAVTPRRYAPSMGLSLPPSLSPSAMSAFTSCPLAFKFSYLDRLPEPPSPPATKGTLVHRALELLLDRPASERTIDRALGDLDVARSELEQHPDMTELDLSDDEWSEFHADAEALVRRYFDLEDPTTVHPVGLELKLEAPVGDTMLRGVIDRLDFVTESGEFVVTDYKTGSVPTEMYENARLSGVHVYALLVERTFGIRPSKLQLYYLSKPEAIIATPTEQKIVGVERKTAALWKALLRACGRDDFRPKPSGLCDYCTFKPYCPAHGGDPTQAEELRGPGTVIPAELPLVAT
jgi:putative RecB family exonuclease